MMLWTIPKRTLQLERMASVKKVMSSEQRMAECEASSCGRNQRSPCHKGQSVAQPSIRSHKARAGD